MQYGLLSAQLWVCSLRCSLIERRHLIQDEIKVLSILHNKLDVFESRHVFQRVADDRNNVRPFTSLEGASFIVAPRPSSPIPRASPKCMATILRIRSPGKTSYQARLPVAHDPDVRAKPRSSSPRAANGTPSRDEADKALGPLVAVAHPLRFHPSGPPRMSSSIAILLLQTPSSQCLLTAANGI